MASLTHRTGQSGDSESLVHEEVFCPELISDNVLLGTMLYHLFLNLF